MLTVWSGLCTSTIGEDLFRVASVWLAVEVAGNMAGLVTGVQYVAMLVAGLFGGVLFDRWRPDRAMIGSRAWSAAFAVLPVVGFYFSGLSITLLIISSVGLASLRMVFSPALQSTIPTLVRDRGAQQAINGLFDATYRIARLVERGVPPRAIVASAKPRCSTHSRNTRSVSPSATKPSSAARPICGRAARSIGAGTSRKLLTIGLLP